MKRVGKSGEIGAAEAQAILGIHSRTYLHSLIKRGQLSARVVDDDGPRYYLMKRADVLALKETDFRKRAVPRPKQQRALWMFYFGPIPKGFSPIFRDGNRRNIAPTNLCLIPKAWLWTAAARGKRNKRRRAKVIWTARMIRTLRDRFPNDATADVARELGVSVTAARKQASRLRLRKDMSAVRVSIGRAVALPIGTERLHPCTGFIYVKVTDVGTYRQQWRPKHHVIWERTNGRPVPTRNVIFRDGDKTNFEPSNLVALSREESSALANIRFHHMYPKGLKDVIRLTTKIRTEAARQISGKAALQPASNGRFPRKKGGARLGECRRRWTPQMDALLRRDYAHKSKAGLAAALGVTEGAARQRARRLQLGPRLPETIMAEARAKAEASLRQERSYG